jgi:DNA polymerase-3 subunit beta
MKFIISKTALEMAVKNICRVINPKNALPILADILCMVDEERKTITMTGSDSEAWLTYQLALQECEGGGPFCIGADLLRDALAELTEQPLTILATTESDNRFTLKHESGTTVLPLELSDEYPTPRRIDSSVNEWTLESGMLKRVLKRSMFATANDDLRPVMNGVYFDQQDGVLNVVASNGHVLIRNAEEVDNLPDSFIMTKKAANLLPTLMDGDDEVVMTFDDRAVRVEQGLMSFTFLMVEGKYPNYMSVIPQDAPYSLTADRPALLKALRNVAHFTNNSSRLVKLTMLSNQTMELRGEDFDFSTEATDSIGIDYPAGRDMTLGVKADSIIDELSRIIEPQVTIHFTDPSRAVTITPIDPLYQGEEITMLLMPMLVNEE